MTSTAAYMIFTLVAFIAFAIAFIYSMSKMEE
jgi:hypothetical protein